MTAPALREAFEEARDNVTQAGNSVGPLDARPGEDESMCVCATCGSTGMVKREGERSRPFPPTMPRQRNTDRWGNGVSIERAEPLDLPEFSSEDGSDEEDVEDGGKEENEDEEDGEEGWGESGRRLGMARRM